MLASILTIVAIVAFLFICYLVGKKADDDEVGALLNIWLGAVYILATCASIEAILWTYSYLQPLISNFIN